nr:hypothetical protein [Tanacetum cinerariifolium]
MIKLRGTFQAWLQQQKDQVVNLDSYSPKPLQCQKIPIYCDDDDEEESSTPLRDIIISKLPSYSSIISSSKIYSLLDEFAGELIFLKSIPPGIDKADYDPEEEIRLIVKFLYDNSSPRPPKEINSKNFDAVIESFYPSPILVEDIDLFMEEIDLFLTSDGLIPPEFNSETSDAAIESFCPSPIFVEDSDPFMEEIDLLLASDGSIPPGTRD